MKITKKETITVTLSDAQIRRAIIKYAIEECKKLNVDCDRGHLIESEIDVDYSYRSSKGKGLKAILRFEKPTTNNQHADDQEKSNPITGIEPKRSFDEDHRKSPPRQERREGPKDRRDGILGKGRGARSLDGAGWPYPPFSPPHEQRTGPTDRRHEKSPSVKISQPNDDIKNNK